jgi:hypothetical protein
LRGGGDPGRDWGWLPDRAVHHRMTRVGVMGRPG